MLCCGAVARCASYDAHVATAPQHIPTQHDMLPQHLVCKYELKCEYCNMTLARNKAPWWWSEKVETCRSVLCELYVHLLVDKSKWFFCVFVYCLPCLLFTILRPTAKLVSTIYIGTFLVYSKFLNQHKIALVVLWWCYRVCGSCVLSSEFYSQDGQ